MCYVVYCTSNSCFICFCCCFQSGIYFYSATRSAMITSFGFTPIVSSESVITTSVGLYEVRHLKITVVPSVTFCDRGPKLISWSSDTWNNMPELVCSAEMQSTAYLQLSEALGQQERKRQRSKPTFYDASIAGYICSTHNYFYAINSVL